MSGEPAAGRGPGAGRSASSAGGIRRWWLWIALLLSLGVNLGILLTLAAGGFGPPPGGVPAEPNGIENGPRGPRGETPPRGERPRRLGEGPPDEPRLLGRLADRLELRGEERDRFLDLQRRFFRRAFEARRQGTRLQAELGLELTAEQPDRQRIEELVDELVATRRQVDRALVATILETRELLDGRAEQEYLAFVRRLRERPGRQGGRRPRP